MRIGTAALRHLALTLARRPLLGLTLAVVVVLLISGASETVTAWRLESSIQQARQENNALRAAIVATQRQVAEHQNEQAISDAAERLGWVWPPCSPEMVHCR